MPVKGNIVFAEGGLVSNCQKTNCSKWSISYFNAEHAERRKLRNSAHSVFSVPSALKKVDLYKLFVDYSLFVEHIINVIDHDLIFEIGNGCFVVDQ